MAGSTLEGTAGDIKSLVQDLKKQGQSEVPKIEVAQAKGMWQETNCYDVVFEADRGAKSDIHMVTSTTWIEECRPIGHPHGGCIPDRRPWNHVASFEIEILGRKAPAPREVFEVCMTGPWLKFEEVKESPFSYEVSEKEEGDVTRFTLKKKTAEKKEGKK